MIPQCVCIIQQDVVYSLSPLHKGERPLKFVYDYSVYIQCLLSTVALMCLVRLSRRQAVYIVTSGAVLFTANLVHDS